MTDSFQRKGAVRHTRLLLVRAGLTESEADAFLERLRKEFTRGNLQTKKDQDEFCGLHLREIASARDSGQKGLAPQWGDLKTVILNALGSSLGTALVVATGELVKAQPGIVTAPQASCLAAAGRITSEPL